MSSITFECHVCKAMLKVPADKAGKKARCKCGTIVTIPSASPSSSKLRPAEPVEDEDARPRRRRHEEEDLEEDRPRKARRREDEVDDFDEDRPRKKRRRDEDEDDFDDDDRPRRRRDRAEDDDDDRPRRRRRRDEDDDYDDRPRRGGWRDAWPRVRLGFLLAFIGAIVYIAGYGIDQLCGIIRLSIIVSQGIGPDPFRFNAIFSTLSTISRIAVLAGIGGLITGVVGYVFWIFVTNKQAKLAFAIATLSAAATYVVLYLLFVVIPAFDQSGGIAASSRAMYVVLNLLQAGALAAVWILAALYIKAVARTLKDRDLGDKFLLLLVMAAVSGGIIALSPLLLLAFQPNRTSMIISLILKVITAGVHIFSLVLFIVAFNQARETTEVR